jgi:hypothetical protein
MRLEETIMDLTARTPNGGGFWLGNHYLVVRYSLDSWEWEYRGNIFYDLQDLAEEILKGSEWNSRQARYITESLTDRRSRPRV